MKKSLNSDKFKERRFVLDKDQLFYFKNEKQSTFLNFMKYRGKELQLDHAQQRDYSHPGGHEAIAEVLLPDRERKPQVHTRLEVTV